MEYDASCASFTRAAQLDPDNGQCWNNLAALSMRQERWRLAFVALTQALRHSAGTWQVWDNYARASVECGELGSTCRAIG